jgi:hypothetical protein
MDTQLKQRLASQMSRGEIILFTGAGFSLSAFNRGGNSLPSANRLREILWAIAFPNDPIDDVSSLADVFEVAMSRAGTRIGQILKEEFAVDSSTLPDVYSTWFSIPWARIYTLNIDDLDDAVQRAFELPRQIQSISALTDGLPTDTSGDLLSIHLNGRANDYPQVTFSQRQYGERTARPDPWYQHLVTDLSGHPILFVGTVLDEAPLWQNIELRRGRDRRTREMRPGSYLVTPSLSTARRAMLEGFNVQLIEMTQEEFATEVLETIGAEKQRGFEAITSRRAAQSGVGALQKISELRNQPNTATGEFLLGREPMWADLMDGTAVKREFETELKTQIEDSRARVILLTGTAGSGKSTTMMRLALEYHAEGKNVLWLNTDRDLRLTTLRNQIREANASVIGIDNADNFGTQTGPFLANLAEGNPDLLVIASMRSTRFDRLEVQNRLEGLPNLLYTIPYLEDSDIGLLLDALTRAGRLGQLRGKTRFQQEEAFRNQAGRQLLVAMIQATSGERFEEKIDRECRELGNELGLIYAIVAIATNLRTYITKEEILLASGSSSNNTLNQIQSLLNQRLLVDYGTNQIRLRHRVVADRALEYYRIEGQLREPVKGLLWTMATKVYSEDSTFSREAKLLRSLISHERMINLTSDRETPRQAYAAVEGLLDWNYHYYLQRGSYEVETGDLNLAKNFLEQARSLAPGDHMVQTEWAYMSLKRAAQNATAIDAKERAEEAMQELEDAIGNRGRADYYPYHILGSQGLSWVRNAILSTDEKTRTLARLLNTVQQGVAYHPRRNELKQLADDIQREYLMMAVPSSAKTGEGDSSS